MPIRIYKETRRNLGVTDWTEYFLIQLLFLIMLSTSRLLNNLLSYHTHLNENKRTNLVNYTSNKKNL
jgi:hypothetical protein